MSNSILFDLSSKMILKNGSDIIDIVNVLQKFTDMPLYIDADGSVNALDEIYDADKGSFELLGFDVGYVLKKKISHEVIHVFNKMFMEHLTDTKKEEPEISEESVDLIAEIKKRRTQFVGNLIAEEYDYDIEDFSHESDESLVGLDSEDETSDELLSLIKELEEKYLSEASEEMPSLVEDSEEMPSLVEDSEEMPCLVADKYFSEDSEEMSSLVEDSEEKYFSEASEEIPSLVEDSEEKYFSETSEEIPSLVEDSEEKYFSETSSTDYDTESNRFWFRMFLRSSDNITTYLNPEIFKLLESENEINMKDTITLSFEEHLKHNGYLNPKVSLDFFQNKYAEICITLNSDLDDDIIEEIEDNALLNLYDDEVIFFIFRENKQNYEYDVDQEITDIINVVDDIIKTSDDSDGKLFASEVPLFVLPDELIMEIIDRADYLEENGDNCVFYYEDSEFMMIKEEENINVFDLNNYMVGIPHLHPKYYPNYTEYSELPIAQIKCI